MSQPQRFVSIINSEKDPKRWDTGLTSNVELRLADHKFGAHQTHGGRLAMETRGRDRVRRQPPGDRVRALPEIGIRMCLRCATLPLAARHSTLELVHY